MKKRFAAILCTVAVAITALLACLGLAGCSSEATVTEIYDLGEFGGREVYYAQIIESGKNYDNDEPSELSVGGVYMITRENSSYNLIVYDDYGEYILLYSAYMYSDEMAGMNFTHDDLEAIAAALAQYDTLRSDATD